MQSRRLLLAVAIAVIGGVYYYCNQQVNPVTGEKQHVAMTQDQEVAMGLQTAPEMEAQFAAGISDVYTGPIHVARDTQRIAVPQRSAV